MSTFLKQFRAQPYTKVVAASVVDSREHFLKVVFSLEGQEFVPGDYWTATIDGIDYSIQLSSSTDRSDRTPATIAEKLAEAINGDNRFDVTSNGANVIIVDHQTNPAAPADGDDPVTVSVTRDGGTVRGTFDIDNTNLITGTRNLLVGRLFQAAVFSATVLMYGSSSSNSNSRLPRDVSAHTRLRPS